MNDPVQPEPTDDAFLASLLADPALWDEPDQADEDAIVALIAAEAGERSTAPALAPEPADGSTTETAAPPSNVVPLRGRSRWAGPLAGAVAAAAVVTAGFLVWGGGGDDLPADALTVAMEATDVAPDAAAEVTVAERPNGTQLLLDVSSLPPAEPGTYYEAWLRTGPEVGVSAGTFHLRSGDGEIELWAGVSPDDYPLLTVTVQEEARPESSGVVVLRVRLDEAG